MHALVRITFTLGLLTGLTGADAQQLSGGGGHTCAIVPGASVMCWGWDEQGQLGDTAQNYSWAYPSLAAGLIGATAVDGGYQHGCAVVADGAVKCWGSNGSGQLGDDTMWSSNVGVFALGLLGATAISTGSSHSCALVSGGSVWCWGYGYHGQLGDGAFNTSDVPVQVALGGSASAIAAGDYFTCAIVSGTVQCWGRNDSGQLGNGGTTPDPGLATPADVTGISTAIAISAGGRHACVLLDGGSVRCWGHGGYGSLGDGLGSTMPTPVTVSGISDAIAIASGDYHTCVIHAGGTMSCWGYNYFGTVGDGTNRNNQVSAQTVIGVSNVTAIGAGSEHTCARVHEDAINVKCWGHGQFGQLGDGQISGAHENPIPAYVLGSFDVVFGGDAGDFE